MARCLSLLEPVRGRPASSPPHCVADSGKGRRAGFDPGCYVYQQGPAEMGERVERLLGHGSLTKPLIATFHSLCVRMLRRDIEALESRGKGLTRTFAIYDENDQQAIVKQAMRRMGLDTSTDAAHRAPDFVGQEPHDRSAGVLPRVEGSHQRAHGAALRDLRRSCGRTTRLTSTTCCWRRCAC